jgi:hypothetical protein
MAAPHLVPGGVVAQREVPAAVLVQHAAALFAVVAPEVMAPSWRDEVMTSSWRDEVITSSWRDEATAPS